MKAFFASLLVIGLVALAARPPSAHTLESYAVFAEYAREVNRVMQPGLNRRVFNVTEARRGDDIALSDDGSITLAPGTYRLTGFSLVTMQTTFAPPIMKNGTNYPGYCLVHVVGSVPDPRTIVKNAIAIGTPQTAFDGVPSVFDAIYTAATPTRIALAHQSGRDLHGEVYLSVYNVEGTVSDTHVFARIAITRM